MEDNNEAPAFKPTWLIDTSDMSLVPGSDVCEPYYTLSYSWNQSGDYFKNEHNDEYTRIDRGLHTIILDPVSEYLKEVAPPPRVRYVKFEELIKEISQDFGARYIWWDQMCINQLDKEEKRREIKQMHKIYEKAWRAIVLIPEFYCAQVGDFLPVNHNFKRIMNSEWCKRVWTLVEGFQSNKLVFVGRNIHLYSEMHAKSPASDFLSYSNSLSIICKNSRVWNACLGLSQSRNRATTKKHDYYFAFANMFPEKLSNLTSGYDHDIKELALEFYQQLAQNDPTILFFSAYYGKEKVEKTLLGPGLESSSFPSWTGIHGAHSEVFFDEGVFNQHSFGLFDDDYIVSGSTIKVTCASISVSILNEFELDRRCIDDMPAFSNVEWATRDVIHDDPDEFNDYALKELRSFGNNDLTFVTKAYAPEMDETDYELRPLGLKMTHYLPYMVDGSLNYHNVAATSAQSVGCGELFLTEQCNNCIILYGMRHVWTSGDLYEIIAPVITKDGDYYKSIGMCTFTRNLGFPDIDTETTRTFVIR